MSKSEFELDLEELASAEEFLDYFDIDYEPSIVHVNRLHILQRFHDYIGAEKAMPEEDEARYERFALLLKRAYSDFVESDALTEKVFKVFRMHEPPMVSVSELMAGVTKV